MIGFTMIIAKARREHKLLLLLFFFFFRNFIRYYNDTIVVLKEVGYEVNSKRKIRTG